MVNSLIFKVNYLICWKNSKYGSLEYLIAAEHLNKINNKKVKENFQMLKGNTNSFKLNLEKALSIHLKI